MQLYCYTIDSICSSKQPGSTDTVLCCERTPLLFPEVILLNLLMNYTTAGRHTPVSSSTAVTPHGMPRSINEAKAMITTYHVPAMVGIWAVTSDMKLERLYDRRHIYPYVTTPSSM